MSEKISIIVPVYNAERYLADCIESICASHYHNIEIILINDGSTDSSNKICNEYASLDARIVVHHQANGGVSAARNAGISMSTGEYIAFVDSDDLVKPSIYEELINALYESDADLSLCKLLRYTDGVEYSYYEPFICGYLDRGNLWDSYVLNMLGTPLSKPQCAPIMGSVWRCIYKKSIIKEHGIIFRDIKIAEDMLFNLEYICYCNSAVIVDKALYLYRDNLLSATRNYKADLFDNLKKQVQMVEQVLRKHNKLGAIEQEYLQSTWIYYVTWCINNECHTNNLQSKWQICENMDALRSDERYNGLLNHRLLAGMYWKERLFFYIIKYRLWSVVYWYNRRWLLWEK